MRLSLLLMLQQQLVASDCAATVCCLGIAAAALRSTLLPSALLSSSFLFDCFCLPCPSPLPCLIWHDGFVKSILEFLLRKHNKSHDGSAFHFFKRIESKNIKTPFPKHY